MMFLVRRYVLLLAVFVPLAACETADTSVAVPQITFQHAPQLSLAVSKLEVVTGYAPPLSAPHVDHKMETTPSEALGIWARDRLRAVGARSGERARLTIERGAVTETALPRTKGFKGAFTTDQSHRYDLNMQATLEILDATGQRVGHASTRATRNQTMPEDATLNDLHRAWFKMMEDGLQDFDREMEANIRRFLAAWIR